MTCPNFPTSSSAPSALSAGRSRRLPILNGRSIAVRAVRLLLKAWQYSDWGARYLAWLEPIVSIGQVVVSQDLGQGVTIALFFRLCRAVLGFLDVNYLGMTAWLVAWSTTQTPAHVVVLETRRRG